MGAKSGFVSELAVATFTFLEQQLLNPNSCDLPLPPVQPTHTPPVLFFLSVLFHGIWPLGIALQFVLNYAQICLSRSGLHAAEKRNETSTNTSFVSEKRFFSLWEGWDVPTAQDKRKRFQHSQIFSTRTRHRCTLARELQGDSDAWRFIFVASVIL